MWWQVLVVPDGVTDDEVVECAGYRTRARFPVLVWRSLASGAAMCRSSQPRVHTHSPSTHGYIVCM